MGLGLTTHLVEVHPGRIEVEIQMEINIEIESLGDCKDARDLPVGVTVGVRAAAKRIRTGLACRYQQVFSAGIVEQAFLRKHADVEIDRPAVVLLETLDRGETF